MPPRQAKPGALHNPCGTGPSLSTLSGQSFPNIVRFILKSSWLWLVVFVVAVSGIGALIGMNFPPGPWFDALQKPWFQPPNSVFAPVWTILYVMIGIAGWRVFCLEDDPRLRMMWIVQMVLNFLWSPVFFGLETAGGALIVIALLWLVLVSFIRLAWVEERVSAWLFLPYLAWVSFATALNGAIWYLNRGL